MGKEVLFIVKSRADACGLTSKNAESRNLPKVSNIMAVRKRVRLRLDRSRSKVHQEGTNGAADDAKMHNEGGRRDN